MPRIRVSCTLAAISASVLLISSWGLTREALTLMHSPTLLLAPMLELTDTCVLPGAANAQVPASLEQACTKLTSGRSPSAAALVENTLSQLPTPTREYALGYTLAIPLLQLYAQDAHGRWQIQPDRVQRYVHTLRDAPQQAVVYLFGTHFSAHAPLEKALAQDVANIAHSPKGPLPVDDYMGSPLYPWSVARVDNTLTVYRQRAIHAVIDAICHTDTARDRVRAITLLGEVHQLFPHFSRGAGFGDPYLISDYSATSTQQFRRFLQKRFHSLRALNQALHAGYTDWAHIHPPREPLTPTTTEPPNNHSLPHLHTHIDAYAHGLIPVSGWAFIPDAQTHADSRILVYVDGRQVARIKIDAGRQDVLEAKPEFAHRSVGWQTMLDYRSWSTGEHQIDIYLSIPGHTLQHLGHRRLRVVTAVPRQPSWQARAKSLPLSTPAAGTLAYWIDLPHNNLIYLHNPLVEYWHTFRQQQVNQYLRHFANVLDASCLAGTPLYLHQIVPHTNPGWDPQKFAIQRSLRAQPGLQLGVSLYGEPGLSPSFVRDLLVNGHRSYGVTEFHPLKPLSPQALKDVLDLHRRSGAAFFSFFLEPMWQQHPVHRAINPFSLAPGNPHKGSDITFSSLQEVLRP